jgi:aminocarboxymuconate-semialdehyde decarboxylase
MDKNSNMAKLPRPASDYLKRMYTDTVSPHAAGMKFAIEYYGIDHVMYGTDYPCWDPATALKLLDQIELSPADRQRLFYDNARRILGLRDPAQQKVRSPDEALAKSGISQSAA